MKELGDAATKFVKQGLTFREVGTYAGEKSNRMWAGVWNKGNNEHYVTPGQDWSSFVKLTNIMTKKDFN